jgi:hypothetical protein
MLPALLLLCLGLFGTAAISVAPAADARMVAVVMRPGATILDAAALAERSDAALLRAGALSNIWVFASDSEGLARRLERAGAWLLLDPVAAGGCLSFLGPNDKDLTR